MFSGIKIQCGIAVSPSRVRVFPTGYFRILTRALVAVSRHLRSLSASISLRIGVDVSCSTGTQCLIRLPSGAMRLPDARFAITVSKKTYALSDTHDSIYVGNTSGMDSSRKSGKKVEFIERLASSTLSSEPKRRVSRRVFPRVKLRPGRAFIRACVTG